MQGQEASSFRAESKELVNSLAEMRQESERSHCGEAND